MIVYRPRLVREKWNCPKIGRSREIRLDTSNCSRGELIK